MTHVAVASCGMDGKWGKNAQGSIMCFCIPKGGGTGGATGAMTVLAKCMDGRIESMKGEQCEGANLMGMICMKMGMGNGMFKCDPTTCHYDTSMCMTMPGGMGGNGAASDM